MAGHILTGRTYVNADRTRIVPEASPDAAFLLGGEGDEVDDDAAKRLGLGKPAKEEAEPPKARKP